jgi:hypothetical protein
MKESIQYIVRAKLIRFIQDNKIDFFEPEERFINDNPIIAREQAFSHYQSFIEVLLEGKNKKYISDKQAREDLISFIDPGTVTKVIIDDKEVEFSDSHGNGIGIYMAVYEPSEIRPNALLEGNESLIHGIGNMEGYSYDTDFIIYNLQCELDFYRKFNYETKNIIKVVYCSRDEWMDGYRDSEPSMYEILETPFDWDGYYKPYWWGEPEDETIELQSVPKTITEIIKQGESNQVEFKPSLLYNFSSGRAGISIKGIIAKSICAFLNSNGGLLFIGITDKGEIQGLDYDYNLANGKNPKDFFQLEFDQMVKHFISFSVRSNLIGQFYELNGKEFFVVTVSPSKRRPIFFKGQEGKEFYVRGEASTRQLIDIEEIANYCLDKWLN